jgi:triphosphatase
MVDRQAAVRADAGTEHVHKMRVATRRMRAGWRIFGDAFQSRKTRRLRTELRDVARLLGGVRDLDVQIEGLEAHRLQLRDAERTSLEPLVAAWRVNREAAQGVLAAELDSDRYRRFVEDTRTFVETRGFAVRDVPATEPHLIRDTAPSRIWAAYEQARAYDAVVLSADVETLHELRIAAKWLRYSMEFVREALGPEVDELIQAAVGLQDHLGSLHDADVAAGLARSLLVERGHSMSAIEQEAIGRFVAVREREVEQLRGTVGEPWSLVAAPHFRRLLGKAVARL